MESFANMARPDADVVLSPRSAPELERAGTRTISPRLTLVISSLSAGGAERVMTRLASYWAERGLSITLITLFPRSLDFYSIHSRIERVTVNLAGDSNGVMRAVRSNCRRVLGIRRAIVASDPDVVLSFGDTVNVLVLLATRGLDTPVIVAERTDPTAWNLGRAWSGLRRLLYPRAAAVVVQNSTVAEWARRLVPAHKVRILPNPVPDFRTRSAGPPEEIDALFGETTVVGMGRLSREKGFDLLIQAFAHIRTRFPQWRLVILGEGGERAALEQLVMALGLEGVVYFPGQVTEPERYLRRAGLFVLPSRVEGFPNALLEAMAVGLPVIATDCPSGPREIVRHGRDGLLVPPEDVDALAEAIAHVLARADVRAALARRAPEVLKRFGITRIAGMWDLLFHQVASPAGRARSERPAGNE